MPLIPAKVKKTVEAKVLASFQREFGSLQGSNPEAAASWQKQAAIAGDIAEAIVEVLLLEAQVAPGIPVATATGAGATTGPGKIT